MFAALDETQVRKIAKLARLHLSDAEVKLFGAQLGKILAYMEQLGEVRTEGVEPLAHPLSASDGLRDDEPRASLEVEAALANAPERHDGLFKAPPVIESGA